MCVSDEMWYYISHILSDIIVFIQASRNVYEKVKSKLIEPHYYSVLAVKRTQN